ncbi:LysR family transcriptional regulator [Enterococcus entomosocium]|uniref:LysR family transcriptional regulator n=1 Tax=Enterococcus entomosocium TaxID=3034352 RepID=UPI003D6ACA3A
MNFEQLLYAEVLSHHKSMQEAAEALNITKSGLSLAISQLEDELNVKIFIRSSKGTTITTEGKQLLASIFEILKSKNALEKNASLIANPQNHQKISINYMNTMLTPFIDSFIDDYEEKYSDTFFDITCHSLEAIINNVRNKVIDAGFIAIKDESNDAMKNLTFSPICHTKLVLVCSLNNSLCRQKEKITIEQLKSQRFSLFNDELHDTIFERLQLLCGPLQLVLRVDDSWAMSQALNKLNAVSFGRIAQGKLSRDRKVLTTKTIDIGHLIDDSFVLGWLTNPNYKKSAQAEQIMIEISTKIKKDVL